MLNIPNLIFSEQTDKIIPSLVSAINSMDSASKNAKNPHLHNYYADLTSIMEAIKPSLADNGLALMQPASYREGKVIVTSVVVHGESGQFCSSELEMVSQKSDPQSIGATITYARRYAAGSMFGLVAEMDDDGNSGSGREKAPPQPISKPRTAEPKEQAKTAEVPKAAPKDDVAAKAKDLKAQVMKAAGCDDASMKVFYAGVWGKEFPKQPAAYIEPLEQLLSIVQKPELASEFKKDPGSFGKQYRESVMGNAA